MKRRDFLKLLALVAYPNVVPHHRLQFPRDHGAHPDYRTEWWYITGWLDGAVGFQITFFRFRPDVDEANPSAFNPRRILVAVPVAAPDACEEFQAHVDEVICAFTPEPFHAVGIWYEDFAQTSDAEVRELLERAAHVSAG